MPELTERTSDRVCAGDSENVRSSPSIRTTDVYLVFTSAMPTLRAARVAHTIARALDVPLTLIYFRQAAVAVATDPLARSPVDDTMLDQLSREGIETRLRVYLCRDGRKAIPWAFRPHSLIVIGGRRSRWPTQAERWRRALEANGHFVVFVGQELDAA